MSLKSSPDPVVDTFRLPPRRLDGLVDIALVTSEMGSGTLAIFPLSPDCFAGFVEGGSGKK